MASPAGIEPVAHGIGICLSNLNLCLPFSLIMFFVFILSMCYLFASCFLLYRLQVIKGFDKSDVREVPSSDSNSTTKCDEKRHLRK